MITVSPINRERSIPADQLLVTHADLRGGITYANGYFCQAQACGEKDLIGQPHNLMRHPDMPAAVFHLIWERIRDGREIFAYVKNMACTGEYYWTLSHLTPHFDGSHRIDSYQCFRRAVSSDSVMAADEVYDELRLIERNTSTTEQALAASRQRLDGIMNRLGMDYDQWILSLVMRDEESSLAA
ncbi:MAG: PAS domain-containing protein [Ferrovibrio sp.]